ncbi:MAG: exodeoxyribonuclease VII large subunit [Acidimicrobiales bacterium]|nr:exodeoxyribonuclease VII large subunit [Acidimicrobiales bacterium]
MKASAIGDPLSVAEVCDGISEALLKHFGTEVWVRGAISGLNRSANGHVYFTLVDPEEIGGRPTAVLNVALFARAKAQVNAILKRTGAMRMEDGIEVSIAGSVEHYASGGRVQLIMSMIDPSYTIGQLAANKAAVLRRLADDGLLHRNKQLGLPVLPLRIALITSGGSAAQADFMHELDGSGISFSITLFDVRVQGLEAPPTIVSALESVRPGQFDVVALVRGGGAKTDLVAFDDFGVAAAIARCPTPVVVGVGHEVDRSIADETAAVSTKTPTAAAGWILQQVLVFDQRVEVATERLMIAARAQMVTSSQDLSQRQRRLVGAANAATAAAERHLERSVFRLGSTTRQRITAAAHELEMKDLRQKALDPALVMARGWSITRTSDGELVRSVAQVSDGEQLLTQLLDGHLASTITGVTGPDLKNEESSL